jgi:hypothetical protein
MATSQTAPLPGGLSGGYAVARKALFAWAGIQRIHIIGCSRSGTTMLHLAMGCFSNLMLSEDESSPFYPFLGERARLALRVGWRPGRKFYVTKRDSGWYKPKHRDALTALTRTENIGLIYMVRDPRDVMISRHAVSKHGSPTEAYVTPQHWYESILAGEHIFRALSDYPRKLLLRYEDLVTEPEAAERRMVERFGLVQNPDAFPIDRVKDNYERLKIAFGTDQIMALNGLRNMSASSIGRWRSHPEENPLEEAPPPIREKLSTFCAEHGYH